MEIAKRGKWAMDNTLPESTLNDLWVGVIDKNSKQPTKNSMPYPLTTNTTNTLYRVFGVFYLRDKLKEKVTSSSLLIFYL